jgi:hypothetical protein
MAAATFSFVCECGAARCGCRHCHGSGLAPLGVPRGVEVSGANIMDFSMPCTCDLGRQFDAQFADYQEPKPCVDCGGPRTPASLSATRCDDCDRGFVKATRIQRQATSDDVLASMAPPPPDTEAAASNDIAWLQAKLDASRQAKPRQPQRAAMKATAARVVEELTPDAQAALDAWRAKWQAPEATPINPQ